MGDFMFFGGTYSDGNSIGLDVSECLEDRLGIFVPWSPPTVWPAHCAWMEFPYMCPEGDGFPQEIIITLTGASATLYAYDDSFDLVDIGEFNGLSEEQDVTLLSMLSGIRYVEFEGGEFCVLEVCANCETLVPPGPLVQKDKKEERRKLLRDF